MKEGRSTPVMVQPVNSWHASAPSADLDAERWRQAISAHVMTAFHRDAGTCAAPIQTQCDVDAKSVHVVAVAATEANALLLFPCCPTAKAVCPECCQQPVFPKVASNPRAVRLLVGENARYLRSS